MAIFINPLDILLWTVRRNGRDIVKLYDVLSPVMQLSTKGGTMLNFGYWAKDSASKNPILAQKALCSLVADVAGISEADLVVDAGCGLCAPAMHWASTFSRPRICCVNINFGQLQFASRLLNEPALSSLAVKAESLKIVGSGESDGAARLSLVNADCASLPFADGIADAVIALESAQHFRPFENFVRESNRVLAPGGSLVIAMPVLAGRGLASLFRLGILSLTWSSEHYSLSNVRAAVLDAGFDISDLVSIGHDVYEPLADYYLANRDSLRKEILTRYPSFVEKILYRSILKMKRLSENNVIDYIVLKGRLKG